MNKESNIRIFEDLLMSTNREGIEKLIEYCRTSDFYNDGFTFCGRSIEQ